jgi:amino acid transporter
MQREAPQHVSLVAMQTEAGIQLEDATPAAPEPAPERNVTVALPETRGYRIKNRLLGPPLDTEQLAHERLGIPTALAVFSSDCISSSAYATEQILQHSIPIIGLLAFSLVVPITGLILVVLFFLILSYRETIKAYPTAGGAYMVTRDNFGLLPAQVAGVSLLTDYVLTVAVSTAAGTDALTSAFGVLRPYHVVIALSFIFIIAFGNLRGVRESGKMFAVPTYFFIGIMGLMILVGIAKWGSLHPQDVTNLTGTIPIGTKGVANELFYGLGLFGFLTAFASGGAAVTGVEAISNGVTAFRKPEWKNARVTLFIMGGTLAALFMGLSVLSTKVHPIPYTLGSPTVISQVGKFVFGEGGVGRILFYCLQAGTMLILVLAANTSFADFPRLASFHAGDNFMPKQLTKRGHRLVFSNGILGLAIAASVLLLATGASVDRLIPLYAIGVFTSFTMSQAGMAKHHLTHKEPHWRKGLFINGFGAFLSLIVDIVILVTKFMHGAWVIVVLVPLMVYGLTRLNKQYEAEAEELKEDAPRLAEAPTLRRHVVLVFVENLDLAAARAIQYARTLFPDELRAVHFVLDPVRTEDLATAWRQLGLSRLPLDMIECPDRRIARAALEVVAEQVAAGDTEVTILIPRREYTRAWHRLLHDRTANQIAAALSELPHANVTFVPYQLGTSHRGVVEVKGRPAKRRRTAGRDHVVVVPELPEDCVPIASVRARQRVKVAGRVHSLRVQPWAGQPTLECTLVDHSGRIQIVFLGRRHVAGIEPGAELIVEGMVGEHQGRLVIRNPDYRLLGGAEEPPPVPGGTHH